VFSFRYIFAVVALSIIGAAPGSSTAIAEGALVAGITADDVAIGYSASWAGKDLARQKAFEECQNAAHSDQVKRSCDLIADMHRECVAMAFGNSMNYGWGMDPNLDVARKKALEMCRTMQRRGVGEECTLTMDIPFNSCDQNDRGR